MRRFFPLLLWILMSATPSAWAAVDLFQTRVPVADQSPPARAQAVSAALNAVLVRVTGDTQIAQAPAAAALIQKVDLYAQGSSYERRGDALLLRVTFNGAALTAALQSAGLPVWSANRPSHLLWVGLDGDTPVILTREARASLPALFDAADLRGVPLTLPEGDAQDLDQIKPADLFVGEADALLRASRRYNPDQILNVWVSAHGGRWSANWSQLNAKGITQIWQSSGDSADAALAAGLQALADVEARQYAIRSDGRSLARTTLEVDGIRSLADYARTLNYLNRLSRTQSVRVAATQGARVLFELSFEGSETELQRALVAGSVLREAAATARGALGFTLVH